MIIKGATLLIAYGFVYVGLQLSHYWPDPAWGTGQATFSYSVFNDLNSKVGSGLYPDRAGPEPLTRAVYIDLGNHGLRVQAVTDQNFPTLDPTTLTPVQPLE